MFCSPCPNCFNTSPVTRKYHQELAGGQSGETWTCLKCSHKWHDDTIEMKVLWNLVNLREALGAVPQTKGKK
jgi:hypothetical protein